MAQDEGYSGDADEALMERVRDNADALAFETLVRRHLEHVSRYCAKYLGNASEGEECARESLVRVWVARERYRATAPFRIFVMTVARNQCRNWLRRTVRRRSWADDEVQFPLDAPDGARPVTDALVFDEDQAAVRRAMQRLPAKLREALLLRYDQELSYADIARIVRRPEATVRSRVFHGLKQLRARIEEEELR